jgi:hypothetical protein
MSSGRHAVVPCAERFGLVVDGAAVPADDDTAALAVVARWVRDSAAQDPPMVDPRFRAELRERLVSDSSPSGSTVLPLRLPARRHRRSRRPPGRRAGLVAAAVGLAAAFAAVVALSGGGTGQGSPAQQRPTEAESLAAGRARLVAAGAHLDQLIAATPPPRLADPRAVTTALVALDAQVRSGAAMTATAAVRADDTAALLNLEAWAAGQESRVRAAVPTARPAVVPRLRESADLLARVRARAAALAAQAGCVCLDHAVLDELGPVPCQRCDDPLSPPDPAAGLTPAVLGQSAPLPGSPAASPTAPAEPAPTTEAPGPSLPLPSLPLPLPLPTELPLPGGGDLIPGDIGQQVTAVLTSVAPGLFPSRHRHR